MNRRTFIQRSALASASAFVPSFVKGSGLWMPSHSEQQKILVIIQLGGGNDGLNTVVPISNDIYYSSRPQLAIRPEEVLRLSDEAGLHPKMPGFREIYDNGQMTIINNVGYPEPNRSHFRSMDIWQSASRSDEYLNTGWIGRAMDVKCADCSMPYEAAELDDNLSLALKGEHFKGLAFSEIKKLNKLSSSRLLQQLSQAHDHEHEEVGYLRKTLADTLSSVEYISEKSQRHQSQSTYPLSKLGKKMKSIAELIIGGSPTSVYYVSHNGFDTHVNQPMTQGRLLEQLSEAISAFTSDLKSNGMLDSTLVMTFSEFGRRVKENAGKGTDHGTASQVFLIGGKATHSGLYNKMPNLLDLDEGDIKFEVDFREIYSFLLKSWLQVDPQTIISENILPIPLFFNK